MIASSSGRVSRNSSQKMSSWISSHESLFAVGLDAQQLLLVVPLVEGLRLVEALVALQADQPRAGDLGDALGELRSCRCRQGLRRARACRGDRPGTRRRRSPRRRGSGRLSARREPVGRSRNGDPWAGTLPPCPTGGSIGFRRIGVTCVGGIREAGAPRRRPRFIRSLTGQVSTETTVRPITPVSSLCETAPR